MKTKLYTPYVCIFENKNDNLVTCRVMSGFETHNTHIDQDTKHN